MSNSKTRSSFIILENVKNNCLIISTSSLAQISGVLILPIANTMYCDALSREWFGKRQSQTVIRIKEMFEGIPKETVRNTSATFLRF